MQSMQKLRTRTEQTDGKMESCPAAVAGCWLIRSCVRPDAGRYHARRVTVSHCVTCHTCHTPLSHSHSSHRYLDVPTHQDQVSLSRHTTTSTPSLSFPARCPWPLCIVDQWPSEHSKQYWQEVPRPRDTPQPPAAACFVLQ